MLFNYNSYSLKPGIYEIKNLLSGKSYIGSAKRFKARWMGHSSSLKNRKHQCKHLRNSFNKHFEEQKNDNFIEFHVLEVMENSTKEERLIREEFWINKFKSDGVEIYNSQLKPTNEPKDRSCFSLAPEETKLKHSERSKKNWQNPEYLAKNPCGTSQEKSDRILEKWKNEEYRNKMIEVCKQNSSNVKSKQRLIARSQKTYNGLIAPDGTVYSPIVNLRQFAKDHSVIYNHLWNLVSGKYGQYDGWRSLDNPNPKRKKRVLSEAHKIQIGLSKKGHKYNLGCKRTEETKKKISIAHTGRPNLSAVGNKNFLGKKHTEETKRKSSENQKKRFLEKCKQEAIKLNLTLEEFLKIKEENKKKYQKEYREKNKALKHKTCPATKTHPATKTCPF